MGKKAMTATRLCKPQIAVDIVCNDIPASRFLNNGHVQRAKELIEVPSYLPANSSFLAAVVGVLTTTYWLLAKQQSTLANNEIYLEKGLLFYTEFCSAI